MTVSDPLIVVCALCLWWERSRLHGAQAGSHPHV